MGTALMVMSTATSVGSNAKGNWFGTDAFSTTEANSQASSPGTLVFSQVSAQAVQLPGTSSFVFRNAGANGAGTLTFTTTGTQLDSTHSDTVTAGVLFNWNHIATVGVPTYSWMKINVTGASNHSNFHGAHNAIGVVHDIDNSTRFLTLAGAITADGLASEVTAQWKNRGYTSINGFQVFVTGNARTTTSTITSRVNGSAGNLTATIGPGATGLIQAAGSADTIVSGDLVNLALILGAGAAEDLTLSFWLAHFISSNNQSDTFAGILGITRAASATEHFIPIGGRQTTVWGTLGPAAYTEPQARMAPGFTATVSNPRIYLSANNYSADAPLKVYLNGSATATVTITASGGAGWYENATDTFNINSTDEISFGLSGGSTGTITPWLVGLTFSPQAAPAAATGRGRVFRAVGHRAVYGS